MAIESITEFTGTAKILGTERKIAYEDGCIVIQVNSLAEVTQILAKLESKYDTEEASRIIRDSLQRMGAVKATVTHPVATDAPVGETTTDVPDDVPMTYVEPEKEAKEDEPEPDKKPEEKKRRTRRGRPKKEEQKAAEPVEEAASVGSPEEPETPVEEEEADPLAEDTSIVEDEDDEPVKTVEETPEEDEGEPLEGDEKLIAELLKCTSLRDVVATLEDNGNKTIDAVVAAAVQYKAVCPVLSRINESQLESRVRRTAVGLQIAN